MRIPRKLKKQIPNGVYCYTGLWVDLNNGDYHVKRCYFWTFMKRQNKPIKDEIDEEFPDTYIGWCKYLKHEIEDSCKDCGIKLSFSRRQENVLIK